MSFVKNIAIISWSSSITTKTITCNATVTTQEAVPYLSCFTFTPQFKESRYFSTYTLYLLLTYNNKMNYDSVDLFHFCYLYKAFFQKQT